MLVIKKDETREKFDPEKIRRGILKACEKRPVSLEMINKTVDKIETELRKLKNKEVTSRQIGEKVMRELKKIDNVAYIRFASVYRDFQHVGDFEREIKQIK